ncbi:methyltransferase [Shewanella marina]|uniref:methyltransferase n=1 Tax=Shewanella marina TaxID=487319 RepID=UPI00046ED97B|nr:methyltransferase [Shewanella marina]
MSTHFCLADIELQLHRYPATQESNLQAWDAADEHLIKHLIEQQQQAVPSLLINDSFGALTCALKSLNPQWPLQIETDAKTSYLGIKHNLSCNQLNSDHIEFINSRQPISTIPQLVLCKLPKNLSYFSEQLVRLSQALPQGMQVLISAKAKSINKSILALIEQHFGPASASLTWKKTRIITAIFDGKVRKLPAPQQWQIEDSQLNVTNLSNVFAANKLDIGARIMLDNLPQGDYQQIIDLGCGNGVLGLTAAKQWPNADIHFVDDSEMAVASCQHNWQLNALPADKGHFYWDDCLTHLPQDVNADLVLCNPPFHQGEAITDHIAWQMFLDARNRLKIGGILHIVGNRHLAYHVKLKRLFGNCTTVASNGKFVILQAQKTK